MARLRRAIGSERGQATPEYVGLVVVAATLFAALGVLAGPALPLASVARTVASSLLCAVSPDRGGCAEESADLGSGLDPLQRAYGSDVAVMVGERAPLISFEDDDFVSLPVDYRRCRERSCADSIRHGSLDRTQTGLPPTAFTHVVDCRDAEAAAAAGYDCSGERAGIVYIQYWLYYPDSLTHGLGRVGGYHVDDWESYQVRIGADGAALARASSHHGYNGRSGGLGSVGSDTGRAPRAAWDAVAGQLHVASGSHAGTSQSGAGDTRRIKPDDLRLIPLEPTAAQGQTPGFAISPPWEKGVWRNPESTTTG